jgi:hypothetical protein
VEFDLAGRPSRSLTTRGGVTYTQVFTLDAPGREKQMDVTAPWGSRTIGYTYTGRGQLKSRLDLSGGTTTFEHNLDGQEESRTLPSGLVVGRDYPSTHVTASISYSNAAVHDLLGRGYHQNANGLIDAARMPHFHDRDVDQERVRRYGYDKRGWLRVLLRDGQPTTPRGASRRRSPRAWCSRCATWRASTTR